MVLSYICATIFSDNTLGKEDDLYDDSTKKK